MNRVILIGRLTKDPELRLTSNGSNICNFTLAVTRDYKNSEGEYGADFVNCTAFGKTAEIINTYCYKGNQMAVEGKIQAGLYTDKDGNNKYATRIIVDKTTLIQTKNVQKSNNTVQTTPENNNNMSNTVQKDESDPYAEFGEQVSLEDDNFLD